MDRILFHVTCQQGEFLVMGFTWVDTEIALAIHLGEMPTPPLRFSPICKESQIVNWKPQIVNIPQEQVEAEILALSAVETVCKDLQIERA